MAVSQRGSAEADIGNAAAESFLIDGFRTYVDSSNTHVATHARVADAPTGQGFTHSLRIRVKTAAVTPSTGYTVIAQSIEGYDSARLEFGTDQAKSLTISFWVKSSIAGTYSLTVRNSDSNQNYVTEYSIDQAGTWQKITKTIPGATAGTWLTDSGKGIEILWGIDVGSNFHAASADNWVSVNRFSTANCVNNWSDTVNNAFFLTGVQATATDAPIEFQHEDYATTLAKCQRYYQNIQSPVAFKMVTGSVGIGVVEFPTPMRMSPNVVANTDNGLSLQVDGATSDGFNVTWRLQSVSNSSLHFSVSRESGTAFTVGAWAVCSTIKTILTAFGEV